MNPHLAQLLEAHPEAYPQNMQKMYVRVLEKISNAWGTEELDALFMDLLVADHENRQGFPPEVAREIFSLHLLYEKYKRNEDEADPWALEHQMTMEESAAFVEKMRMQGVPFTPVAMFKAVEQGNTRLAFDFVRAGMDVDVRRSDEWTPLMVTLFNGHEETAMMLLSRGANVRAKARHGYEAIHWAALNGYERAVRFILKKGGDSNATTEFGWTPLLQAATRGHVGIARLLIAKGAIIDSSENEGWTPLHKACANGHVEMAGLLVENGADTRRRSQSGLTPLEIAIKSQNFDLIEALSTKPKQAASQATATR